MDLDCEILTSEKRYYCIVPDKITKRCVVDGFELYDVHLDSNKTPKED